MKVTAYKFALPKLDNNLHTHLYRNLKTRGVKGFNFDVDKVKIIFFAYENLIICRSKLPVPNIPCKIEEIEFELNSEIVAKVNLTDVVQKAFSREKIQNFKKEYGRLPTYKESHHYVNMRAEVDSTRFKEHITSLLEKNGMTNSEILDIKQVDSVIIKGKKDFSLKTHEIFFTAKISDTEKFAYAWLNGIGRQKTYGLGTLRVIVQ